MRFSRIALALAALLPATSLAQEAVPFKTHDVPWGREGRPRDPYVAPDGSVFFVGQAGNYVARLDPNSGEFKRFEIDSGARPHTVIVDRSGIAWYAGNRNGTIGRLDPKTGEVQRFPVPEGVRDPHTMVFDPQGNIWFTAQGSGAVGHFNVTTKQFRIVKIPIQPRSNPYGITMDSKGRPWFNLFATNLIGTIDPKTFELKTYPVGNDSTRNRRIGITSDDKIFYTDYRRGRVGRLDPATGKTDEWLLPGGERSLPYAMTVDDKDRIWVAETPQSKPARLVGFDPKTQQFFSVTELPGERNTVRHMVFDKKTGLIWFGADAGYISRADVSGRKVAM
jgi:virginiamycin B lyase